MIRRRLLLIAAPLCVVVVAASVAFASTPDTEHSSDAKLDDPHAERPVAASNRLNGALGTLLAPSNLRATLQYKADVQVAQVAYVDSLAAAAAAAWVDATAEAAAAAWVEATAAASPPPVRQAPAPAPVYQSGGGAGGALACIRARESDSAGGYQAVSPGGTYRGAYQFLQSTWNSSAAAAGRGDLVGVDPATVSPADQDAIAAYLYSQAGSGPWGGSC